MASGKADATVLVVEAERWSTQVVYGQASLLCKTFGRALAPLPYVLRGDTTLLPVKFLPLGPRERRTNFKLWLSEACCAKHVGVVEQLGWLQDLGAQPHGARYGFQSQFAVSIEAFLTNLRTLNTAAGARNTRWLVTKREVAASVAAVASVLGCAPSRVTLVQTLSEFVSELGRTSGSSSDS